MEMPFRAEMVLNLTRTVATQAVRGFTHQTWVSGRLGKNKTYIYWYFMQDPHALGLHLLRSVLTVFSFLLECSQVATLDNSFLPLWAMFYFAHPCFFIKGPMWILAHIGDYKKRD